jgi:hypothetical protein
MIPAAATRRDRQFLDWEWGGDWEGQSELLQIATVESTPPPHPDR